MQEKNLHQKILDDYVTEIGLDAPPPNIAAFAVYANAWLKNAGVIGLGHTASGMALRLRDGTELLLTGGEEFTAQNFPAVNITGNSAGLQTTTPSRPSDIAITGA